CPPSPLACLVLCACVARNASISEPPSDACTSVLQLTVTSFSIHSAIVSRYSHTQVVSVMTNPHPEALEAVFDLDLPSLAFISNFKMEEGDRKKQTETETDRQKERDEDRGRERSDEVKKFRISTSVAGGGEVAFTLTYEELLPRLLGKYQHAVSVRPGQVVPNLRVEVTISERTGIDYIHVLPLQSSHLLTNIVRGEADLPTSTTIEKEKTCARVIFMPSPSEQAAYSSQGITGDFVIQYDVTMKDVIGDVQVIWAFGWKCNEGKMVSIYMFCVFLLQTKKAMHVILGDLCPKDHFNIVTFSDTVHIWKAAGSIQAIPPNIQRAKAYVSRMKLLPSLGTDMNAALLAAASILNQSIAGPLGEARLIIFLTDGEPTAGVTSPARILANAQRALAGQVALFGLALGDDADLPLLRRLSLENRGTAHRIREDHDAASQLKGFYDRIAYPLLSDIHLHYQARRAGGASPPWSHFPNYFKGSELVVVGQLAKREPELQVHLEALGPYNHLFTAALREEAASGREPTFGCLSQGELALVSLCLTVDGDPHFEIQLPNSKSRICFTVDGRAGDTLQLIRDPVAVKGLQVSGHLLGAPPKAGHEHRTRTYFDRITVTVGRLQDPFIIHVSPHQVSLEMEGVTKRLSWDQPLLILQHRPGLELILQHKSTLTIRLSLHLEFLIRRHRDRHPTPLRLPHLGFYIVSGQGLSQSAQGILGEMLQASLAEASRPPEAAHARQRRTPSPGASGTAKPLTLCSRPSFWKQPGNESFCRGTAPEDPERKVLAFSNGSTSERVRLV
uniref:Inter-alpha-trypsin inhibitor heavy chain family member 6 n=1 Tax=Monodelphis domestica TaxID=13616 RepID=A0A5F8H8H2_MONDO